MEFLKIDLQNQLELWIKIFTVLSAVTGFCILHWKWWARKAWEKWYIHYKNNRNQRWTGLMDVQKHQNEIINNNTRKLDIVVKQLTPNTGSSVFDKIEKVLSNQARTSGTLDAMLYLDDTPTFKCDMNGNCFFVNVAWLQLLGFNDPQDAFGQGWLRAIHPPEKEEVRKEFQEAIKSETQFVKEVTKMNISNESLIPVKMMTRIIRDERKMPIEIVGQLKIKK